jgi:hypothetical protein
LITERRIAKRFRAVDGALAALSPETGRVGQIQNISLNGVAFRYIAENSPEADRNGTAKLQLMFAGQGIWLEGVPVKRIADVDLPTGSSFSGIPLRQTSLQFLALTEAQRTRLQDYIRRFTQKNG